MATADLTPWIQPGLHALVGVLLACVLWRLRRDPARGWEEQEARLRAILVELRDLAEQAETRARELDERLAARAASLEDLVRSAEMLAAVRRPAPHGRVAYAAAGGRPRRQVADAGRADGSGRFVAEAAAGTTAVAARTEGDPDDRAARVRALCEAGVPLEEIARRLGLPLAEARLLAGWVAAARAGGAGDAEFRRGVRTAAAGAGVKAAG
ncbi:MAG TPA: hypothetical protein VFD92_25635 [Candidatus Binatia bacterium]|nr:hypothetical protein [Candidatus Binatia bacterium]